MMQVKERGNRVWKYSIREIAEAAGVPFSTCRKHRAERILDPDSLKDVAKYITGHILLKETERETK